MTLSSDAVTRHAGVFLFFRSNGTAELWRGPNMTTVGGEFPLTAQGPRPRTATAYGNGDGDGDEWVS